MPQQLTKQKTSLFTHHKHCLQLFSCLCLLLSLPSTAFEISNKQDKLLIGSHIHVIYNHQQAYSFADILEDIFSHPKLTHDYVELSMSTDSAWLATKLRNPYSEKQKRLLELKNNFSPHIEFYTLKDNVILQKQVISLKEESKQTYNSPIFDVELPSNSEITLLVKLEKVNSGTLPIIWQQNSFYNNLTWQLPLKGAFIGMLLVLAIYNLIIFIGVKRQAYLWYSMYIFTTILWRSLFSDFGPMYIGSALFSQLYEYIYSMVILAIAFAGLFCINFINLDHCSTKANKILKTLIFACLYCAPVAIFVPHQVAMLMVSILSVICGTAYLIAAFYTWKQGQKSSRFYLISWLPLLIAIAYTQLTIWQLLPNSEWRTHLLDIALLLEALLISIALSDQLRENDAQKAYLSTHDTITNLPNRELLYRQLALYRTEFKFTLIQINITSIDEIANTLGLEVADKVLINLSKNLAKWLNAQSEALVFEHNTDKFRKIAQFQRGTLIIALKEQDNDLHKQCKKIRHIIKMPLQYQELSLQCDCYIGVAFSGRHGKNVEQLIQNVNIAAHIAEERQQAFLLYSDEKNLFTERRLALIHDLKQAIKSSDQLTLHLQPQVNLKTNEVIGCEYLIRWQHPNHGLIEPSEFIPIAENAKMMKELTLWVIKKALELNAGLIELLPEHRASVNISAQNLEDGHFVEKLHNLLEDSKLPTKHLLLEVTESAMMSDPGLAHLNLALLKDKGIQTSIDDFGTGYSSLSYLSLLPVHELKIDRSFIVGISDKQQNYTITALILDLSRSLGLSTVAEGIEDQLSLDTLKELGCDIGQGYYISKPLEFDHYISWLKAKLEKEKES